MVKKIKLNLIQILSILFFFTSCSKFDIAELWNSLKSKPQEAPKDNNRLIEDAEMVLNDSKAPPKKVAEALVRLSQTKNSKYLERFKSEIQNSNLEVKLAALRALIKYPFVEIENIFTQSVVDKDPRVRSTSIHLIASQANKVWLPLYDQLLGGQSSLTDLEKVKLLIAKFKIAQRLEDKYQLINEVYNLASSSNQEKVKIEALGVVASNIPRKAQSFIQALSKQTSVDARAASLSALRFWCPTDRIDQLVQVIQNEKQFILVNVALRETAYFVDDKLEQTIAQSMESRKSEKGYDVNYFTKAIEKQRNKNRQDACN